MLLRATKSQTFYGTLHFELFSFFFFIVLAAHISHSYNISYTIRIFFKKVSSYCSWLIRDFCYENFFFCCAILLIISNLFLLFYGEVAIVMHLPNRNFLLMWHLPRVLALSRGLFLCRLAWRCSLEHWKNPFIGGGSSAEELFNVLLPKQPI